jgi:hypothetical protein
MYTIATISMGISIILAPKRRMRSPDMNRLAASQEPRKMIATAQTMKINLCPRVAELLILFSFW